MTKDSGNVAPLAEPEGEDGVSSAANRWMRDLGVETEGLGHKMRKPTSSRPFVYEVRFDLLPAKAPEMLLVLKGFGEEGGLCAFVNAGSFVQLLRQANGLMASGKMKWYGDDYTPSNYQKRVERYRKGEFYLR